MKKFIEIDAEMEKMINQINECNEMEKREEDTNKSWRHIARKHEIYADLGHKLWMELEIITK